MTKLHYSLSLYNDTITNLIFVQEHKYGKDSQIYGTVNS